MIYCSSRYCICSIVEYFVSSVERILYRKFLIDHIKNVLEKSFSGILASIIPTAIDPRAVSPSHHYYKEISCHKSSKPWAERTLVVLIGIATDRVDISI